MKKKTLISFFAAAILMNVAANLAHPVTPTLIQNLNLPDYMFGAAFAAMMFSNFLFSPFWGKRNEYKNSRNTIAFCSIGYAAGQFLFAVEKTEGTILLARIFSGVFTGGIFISMLTYLVRISKEEDRGKNLAILAAISSVASAFGYFIGGLLGEISIGLAFGLQVGLLLLSSPVFYLVCTEDNPKPLKISYREMIRTSNPFHSFMEARRFMNPTFLLLFLLCGLAFLGNTAFEQCFNYYIKDVYGLSSGYNGTIKALIGIVALLANGTICIWILQKANSKRAMIYIMLLGTLSIFWVAGMKSQFMFIGLSILFFTINAISIPIMQDMVSREASISDRSIVMGFYNGVKSLGGIIGALAAGGLYTIQPIFPILFAGIAFFAATVFSMLFYFNRTAR
ncbi:MAG: transporter, family, multidrug resistance protein [Clostridiales bacterium]|nr:transporter, family, multidrug resistance protein [Clostridiales bacterium]